MDILPLFCEIDDFCQFFEQYYQSRVISDGKKRRRATNLSQSEVMTILVIYHLSGYKNLKAFYLQEILRHHVRIFRVFAVMDGLSNCKPDVLCRCFSIS